MKPANFFSLPPSTSSRWGHLFFFFWPCPYPDQLFFFYPVVDKASRGSARLWNKACGVRPTIQLRAKNLDDSHRCRS